MYHTNDDLAGTMPMQGEVMPEEWSDKNKEEQKLVAEYVFLPLFK